LHEIGQPASVTRKVMLALVDKNIGTLVFFLAYQVGQTLVVFYVELMVVDPCGFKMEELCKKLVTPVPREKVMLSLAT
jgi:hypothetical protein